MGKKKSRRAGELLGNHQKCWLWGRHAVLEMLRAGRWKPRQVVADPEGLPGELLQEVQQLAATSQISLELWHASQLERLSGAKEHQGLMAQMPPYPYADARDVLDRLRPDSGVLILAGIQDPFNFGSILRSADLFGMQAVFVPEAGQARVSVHVARSSVGAINYLEIVETEDLSALGRQLQSRGLVLWGASEKGNCTPAQAQLSGGVGLVIGNEGTGIPQPLLELCQGLVCIPLQGHVGSLNAAVAAGILMYERNRQHGG